MKLLSAVAVVAVVALMVLPAFAAYDPITDFTSAKGTVQTFVEAAAPLYLGFAGLVVAILIGAKWVRKLRAAA